MTQLTINRLALPSLCIETAFKLIGTSPKLIKIQVYSHQRRIQRNDARKETSLNRETKATCMKWDLAIFSACLVLPMYDGQLRPPIHCQVYSTTMRAWFRPWIR
jgi:hypothetical protein